MFSYLVRMCWSLALMASEFLAIVREFFEALWGEPRRCPLASPRRARPGLEVLGGRCVPAVMDWTAPAGATDWGTPGNWTNQANPADHHVPISGVDGGASTAPRAHRTAFTPAAR